MAPIQAKGNDHEINKEGEEDPERFDGKPKCTSRMKEAVL